MRTFLKASVAALALGLLALAALRMIPIHVYDGFESAGLSWPRWSTARMVPGAAVVQDKIVRAGRRALAVTVRSGDRFEAASDDGAASERDELLESWWLYSRTGQSYAQSFSLYLPREFPQTSERLVIAQWKQLCEASACRPDNPILAIRYTGGRLEITRHDERGNAVLYQCKEDVRGRWLDFRFVTRFDPGSQGSIDASLDGNPIIHYRGPTVYQPAHGYPARGRVYFKFGLYRDALNEPPWTIYIDEYRKDQCPESGCQ
jgi:hypothetical protein